MSKKDFVESVPDKERVLLFLVDELARSLAYGQFHQPNYMGRPMYRPDSREECTTRVHIAHREPKPGDLVICNTSVGPHAWTVAYYVERLPGDYGGAILREIGSPKLLRMGNESFSVIHVPDHSRHILLEGFQRKLYTWTWRACSLKWNKRPMPEGKAWPAGAVFKGAEVTGTEIRIKIRCHSFQDYKEIDGVPYKAEPYTLTMAYTKKTRFRDICDFVNANVRKFSYLINHDEIARRERQKRRETNIF